MEENEKKDGVQNKWFRFLLHFSDLLMGALDPLFAHTRHSAQLLLTPALYVSSNNLKLLKEVKKRRGLAIVLIFFPHSTDVLNSIKYYTLNSKI